MRSVEAKKRGVKSKRGLYSVAAVHNYTDQNFGTASRLVIGTLKEPLKMWNSDSYKDKQTILLMYFEQPLRYNYEDGFGTAQLARPIELINGFVSEQNPIVEMEGFEPSSGKAPYTHLQAWFVDFYSQDTSSTNKGVSVFAKIYILDRCRSSNR